MLFILEVLLFILNIRSDHYIFPVVKDRIPIISIAWQAYLKSEGAFLDWSQKHLPKKNALMN